MELGELVERSFNKELEPCRRWMDDAGMMGGVGWDDGRVGWMSEAMAGDGGWLGDEVAG